MAIRKFLSRENGIRVSFGGLTDILVPEYVNRAKKRFSFDVDLGILNKQCSDCESWFPVARISKEGIWEMIYNENEMHFDGKAFRSYCNRCYQKKKSEKEEKAEKQLIKETSENGSKLQNSEMKKVSVFLSPKDIKYLKMCAADLETTVVDH